MKGISLTPSQIAEKYNSLPLILFQLQFQKSSFEEEIEEPEYPDPYEEDERGEE